MKIYAKNRHTKKWNKYYLDYSNLEEAVSKQNFEGNIQCFYGSLTISEKGYEMGDIEEINIDKDMVEILYKESACIYGDNLFTFYNIKSWGDLISFFDEACPDDSHYLEEDLTDSDKEIVDEKCLELK